MSKRKVKTTKKKSNAKRSNSNPYMANQIIVSDSPLKQLYEKDYLYYHLFVNDYVKMKEFYNKILEFDLAGEAPEEYGWSDFYLPIQGVRVGLYKSDKKLENTNAAPSLNITVNDLEKAHQVLKEKGIKVSQIEDIPNMISMFDFRDPEGNRISFLGKARITIKA